MKRKIIFGSYEREYDLTREETSSLKLTVKPDLKIGLVCPLEASEERIEEFLKRKRGWIDKQIDFFKKYQKKKYRKEYVSGESFYFLGKQYQLIVRKGEADRVVLSRDKITVKTAIGKDNPFCVKLLIDMWYKEKSREIFRERFEKMKKRFECEEKIFLRTEVLRKKWGSFRKKTVILNPILIQSSLECIDYVLAHELCHIKYQNHGKEFWKLLNKMYPGWKEVKERLEEEGMKIVA